MTQTDIAPTTDGGGSVRPWRTVERGSVRLRFAGREAAAEALVRAASVWENALDETAISQTLAAMNTPFAAILEGPFGRLAVVDQNRSFPIIYFDRAGRLECQPGIGGVRDAEGARYRLNSSSVLEAAMAGYVTGSRTLYDGVLQLEAGTFVHQPAGGGEWCTVRYHCYLPTAGAADGRDRVVDLADATDIATARAIADADGRPIVVPLSGGLDSRLLLAKLVEHGYPDIEAFSYGLPNNSEAQAADAIARKLGVRWRALPTARSQMRALFRSSERRAYWRFSDVGCAVPNPQEFDVLELACRRGDFPSDAMIINGQSGDFTSGGHIPERFARGRSKLDDVMTALLAKHYDLWRPLRTPANLWAAERWIRDVLGEERPSATSLEPEETAALLERWEHQERQAKYVFNQQRAYDYYGFSWAMPFWDMALVDFWKDVPIAEKIGQRLYKRYVKAWDYRGVFTEIPSNVSAWGRQTSLVMAPASALLHHIPAVYRMPTLQKTLAYFGRFGHHYSAFGYAETMRLASEIRNPISLYVRQWLMENGVAFDELRHGREAVA